MGRFRVDLRGLLPGKSTNHLDHHFINHYQIALCLLICLPPYILNLVNKNSLSYCLVELPIYSITNVQKEKIHPKGPNPSTTELPARLPTPPAQRCPLQTQSRQPGLPGLQSHPHAGHKGSQPAAPYDPAGVLEGTGGELNPSCVSTELSLCVLQARL